MEEFGLMSSTLSDNFSKLKDMIQNAKKEVWYITEMFEEGHGDLNEHKDTILRGMQTSKANRSLNLARWQLYHKYFGSFVSEAEL